MRKGRRPSLARAAAFTLAAAAGVAGGVTIALARSPARADRPPLEPRPQTSPQVAWRAGARRAPSFSLRDEAGRTLSLRSLRGRVVMLAFLDSRCRASCPVDGHQVGEIQLALRGTRFDLLVVTVDPWADTAASARAFAASARWGGRWHWLLGSERELRPIWRSYSIAVLRARDIVHTRALYLIDPLGYLRAGYLFPLRPLAVARDARTLASPA
jgi:cytochrome oxidase Cu insertion factor (SCO1/SenC/PrrC family)